uniref:Uncharacterized protein n=1 Tax=Romanomermis culicivorax TaxID=13658 RepID=A0A915I4T0_ROMCU
MYNKGNGLIPADVICPKLCLRYKEYAFLNCCRKRKANSGGVKTHLIAFKIAEILPRMILSEPKTTSTTAVKRSISLQYSIADFEYLQAFQEMLWYDCERFLLRKKHKK